MSDQGNNPDPNQGDNNPNQGNDGNDNESSSSRTLIAATFPVGGITITQPPQTATSFYKIAPNQLITFGWNMTSVHPQASPDHLTLSAICANSNTYPVGPTDGIIPGDATEVVWDVYKYQTDNPGTPLPQAMCTLNVWDERGSDAPRRPGFMAPNSALRFALYTPQPYTGLSDGWSCSTCNGSLAQAAAHPAFVGLMAMFVVMLLSGFSVIRNAPQMR